MLRASNDVSKDWASNLQAAAITATLLLGCGDVRLQSSHCHTDRGLDAYFSSPCALHSLIAIEGDRIPQRLWEPAAGDGTGMVLPLLAAGFHVVASDIVDYGCPDCTVADYLIAELPKGVELIITNRPFLLGPRFIEKALSEVGYSAGLLRTNFLESTSRLPLFREHPPARVWISSRRLPMLHRHGWTGKRAASNTAFAWFVWDAASGVKQRLDWFDWKHLPPQAPALRRAA